MDYVTLLGAEAVEQAGHRMSSAAESFRQTAAYMEQALLEHSRSIEASVQRLEALFEKASADLTEQEPGR